MQYKYFISSRFNIKVDNDWYAPNKQIWGDRYMDEKKDILTTSRNKKEINIIRNHIKEGGTVLDIPCGYGRLSNSLAKFKYKVTGVDINKYFINIARSEAERKGVKVDYKVKEINKLQSGLRYDAVLNIYTSLGYYGSDQENKKTIDKLCAWVKPGGKLIIELINPYKILSSKISIRHKITKGGAKIKFEDYFDFKTSTNLTRITECYARGKKRVSCTRIRIYFPHELINICHNNNLELECILNDRGKKEGIMASPRLWYIFKKLKV